MTFLIISFFFGITKNYLAHAGFSAIKEFFNWIFVATFPYFMLRVCNERAPSPKMFCTSALMRSPSFRYWRMANSSSAVRFLCIKLQVSPF